MKTLRRLCYATLGVAYTHLVFGAIVRISGSGMGCGDNWPKCYGHWFPPFDRPQLVIEWTHRLLASLLILSILGLATATVLKRREPGVSGRGGVLRPVASAVGVVLVTAAFGAVTVFLGNPTWATVVHWTLAMTLLAVVTTAAIRAGALGGAAARSEQAAASTTRSAYLAAAMAFAAVVMGGLTAKFPFGSVACQSFPGCGRNAAAPDDAVWVQGIHRTIAILLVLHLIGMAIAGRRRSDGAAIKRTTLVAALLGVAQIVVAASMVLFHLPAPLRSLHEAVGVAIWLSTFTLAYLARLASRPEAAGGGERATLPPVAPTPAGDPLPATANVRASSRSALARGAEVQRDGQRADADTTLVIEATDPTRHTRRGRRDVVGHSFPTAVVGEIELVDPDTIASAGEPLSADAIGTAALIAAVERADAATSPAAAAAPVANADDTAAELSLLAEALAAIATEGASLDGLHGPATETVDASIDELADRSLETTVEMSVDATMREPADRSAGQSADASVVESSDLSADRSADASIARAMDSAVDEPTAPESIEAAARSAADDIAATLEKLDALSVESEVDAVDVTDEPGELVAGAEAPLGVAAPADALSVSATVQEQAAVDSAPEAQKARPHTMAVIVARGADL